MAWSKVDDRLFAHPKVLAAGMAAMGLWVMAQSYAACYATDGKLPSHAIALLSSNAGLPSGTDAMALADRLVEVGLWERTESGYCFHDWAQYNPTRSTQRAEKTQVSSSRAEAGRKGAAARWANRESDTNSKNGKTDGKEPMAFAIRQNGPVPVPVPTPEPEEECGKGAIVLPSSENAPSPEQPTPPTETPTPTPRAEPVESEEMRCARIAADAVEKFSRGVLTKMTLTTADYYKLGVIAKELKDKHGIQSDSWVKFAKWIAPSGPGLKQVAGKPFTPSWNRLLVNDGAWVRDCIKQAIDWDKKKGASEYNGRC